MPPSASPSQPWTSIGVTHTGNIRDHNEDACLDLPEQGLWIAADGMGGHTAGDLASNLIIERFGSFTASPIIGHSKEQIHRILAAVNQELWLRAQQLGADIIGSTVAILFATDYHIASVWAGDSRIYRLRDGDFKQITRDHSEGADIDPGPNDSPDLAYPGAVTQAIGALDELQVETEIREHRPGDTYLLCSDGLNKELSDQQIATILKTNDVKSAAEILMREALSRQGRDNTTVVLAHTPDRD